MSDTLDCIIEDIECKKEGPLDAKSLEPFLADISARLRGLKGIDGIMLGVRPIPQAFYSYAKCDSPIPVNGVECIPLADARIDLVDVADGLDRMCQHLNEIKDLVALLDDLISLLVSFRDGIPAA